MKKFLDWTADDALIALSIKSPPLFDWIGFEPLYEYDDEFHKFARESYVVESQRMIDQIEFLDGTKPRDAKSATGNVISIALMHYLSHSIITGTYSRPNKLFNGLAQRSIKPSSCLPVTLEKMSDDSSIAIVSDPIMIHLLKHTGDYDNFDLIPHIHGCQTGPYSFDIYIVPKASISGCYLHADTMIQAAMVSDNGLVCWTYDVQHWDVMMRAEIWLKLEFTGDIIKFSDYTVTPEMIERVYGSC